MIRPFPFFELYLESEERRYESFIGSRESLQYIHDSIPIARDTTKNIHAHLPDHT